LCEQEIMSIRRPPLPKNPALREHAKERTQHFENRIADAITRFAGSMLFVYVHIVWFASWIVIGFEEYPFGLLTMIASLEAIFGSSAVPVGSLSTP
jgi:uncharacterized membrane protein